MKYLTVCALIATTQAATVNDDAKMTNVEDVCKNPNTHVPCLSSDSGAYYCVEFGKTTGQGIGGSGKTVNQPKCSEAVVETGGKVAKNTCPTDSFECTAVNSAKKVTICAKKVAANPYNQSNTALTGKVNGLDVTSFKTPTETAGCYTVADDGLLTFTSSMSCKVTDTSKTRKCEIASGGTKVNVCAVYGASTTASKGKAYGGSGTYKTYTVPDITGGCWGIAMNKVVDSSKKEVCGDADGNSRECKLSDPADSSKSKQVCVENKAALQANGKDAGYSIANTYITPKVNGGCFNSPDYKTYFTNGICNAGSVKCSTKNSSKTLDTCVPYDAKIAGANAFKLTATQSADVKDYVVPAKEGGCFNAADWTTTVIAAGTAVADTDKGVCDTTSMKCMLAAAGGARSNYCVPTANARRGGLVGTDAGSAAAKDSYYPANGCFTVDDYEVVGAGQTCLRYGSKPCTTDGAASATKKICVPPSFNGKKAKVAAGPAKDYTAPDAIGGCWSVKDWQAAGMFDVCAVTTSLKCALSKKDVANKTVCVPKTFTAKSKAVDKSVDPFKKEGADAVADGYASPARGCFPTAGGASQLLAGAAAATAAVLALY